MSDDVDLFGLELPVDNPGKIKRAGRREIDQEAYEAWELWCDETNRDGRETPDRGFIKAYHGERKSRVLHADLLKIVKGAARVRPYSRDSYDLRRVINAMTKKGPRAVALSLADDPDAEVYPWGWGEDDAEEITFKSTTRQVLEALDMSLPQMSNADLDYISIVMTDVEPDDLPELVKTARAISGNETPIPADLARAIRSQRSGKKVVARANQRRDTYQAGAREREALASVNFDADVAADRLRKRGCPTRRIAEFHALAPEGYWEQAEELIADYLDRETKSDPYQLAYTVLEGTFNWHPEERKEPTW